MIRVGTGYDVHAFKPGDKIYLCGVEIPFDKSLDGHSDADVALHALTDAILGALALGDIGLHFPDTDKKWKGAESVTFLSWSLEQAQQRNLKLTNIDLTIICEKPKINNYREQLTLSLSKICALEQNRINVKATTTERLGFTGREEGIASICSILLHETS
jgi:2-C-methyl-D-erythritol 2,4-cyclodiphosphate synthase